MMTVIAETTVKPNHTAEWDRAFQERIRSAKDQPGWIDVQLLIPSNEPDKRVVVGTWRSREDWERWHATGSFRKTREAMDAATAAEGPVHWYDVQSRAALQA